MKINYRKQKTDVNQPQIVEGLRECGVHVDVVGLPLDLSVTSKSLTAWLEIKVEGSKAVWTREQLKFIAQTKAIVGIAKDFTSALMFALNMREKCLTQQQKDALQVFLDKQPKDKKRFTPKEIEGVLKV